MSPATVHDLSPLANALSKAQNVVCFIHPQATYDAVVAAVSMAEMIDKSGRSASVVCEAEMRPEYEQLKGVNKVSQQLGNRDLVISFDYSEEQVDKVNYNVDEANKRFELIITPQRGGVALDPSTIQYRQAGLAAEVVILFGFHSFDELGQYYIDEKYIIDGAFTIAITQSKVPAFAKFHVALQADGLSYSEWAFYTVRQLQLGDVQGEIATGILSGIEYSTNRLVNVSNARTFETLAQLMNSGARRQPGNPVYESLATPIRDPQPFSSANSQGPSFGNWQPPQGAAAPMNANAQALTRGQVNSVSQMSAQMKS